MDNNKQWASNDPDQLAGGLREAVEQARAVDPPELAVQRALKNAKEIDMTRPFSGRISMKRFVGVMGAMAASILLMLFVELSEPGKKQSKPKLGVDISSGYTLWYEVGDRVVRRYKVPAGHAQSIAESLKQAYANSNTTRIYYLDANTIVVDALPNVHLDIGATISAPSEPVVELPPALRWKRAIDGILITVQEDRTGSLLFGDGFNQQAGATGSILLNERQRQMLANRIHDVPTPGEFHAPEGGNVRVIANSGIDPETLQQAIDVLLPGGLTGQSGATRRSDSGIVAPRNGVDVVPLPGVGGVIIRTNNPEYMKVIEDLVKLREELGNRQVADASPDQDKPRKLIEGGGYDLEGDLRILDRKRREARERYQSVQSAPGGTFSAEEVRAARTAYARSLYLYESYKRKLERRAAQSLEIQETRSDANEPNSSVLRSQVWKRNGRRPTFARVYVGDGNSLELVSLRVSVTIDGPRARTLVDHVFRNPHDQQLEGSFEYPLPTGASPSYFAMFLGHTRGAIPPLFPQNGAVPALPQKLAQMSPEQLVKHVDTEDWGRLSEARIVGRKKALQTYEDIVRGRIDPALLEHAGGNTFRGRVFPIPKKGYNRVLIAYEQLLPQTQGVNLYRYALPDCKLQEIRFDLRASKADCREAGFVPKDAAKSETKHEIHYHKTWTKQGPGGAVALAFVPPQPRVQVISGRHGENGPQYVFARLRPNLRSEVTKPFSDRAVFLLDTSLSEQPDRFGHNVELMKQILAGDPDLKWFKILTFNVGTAWVTPKGWLPNTKSGREKALQRLDGILLEGATDWSAVLDELVKPLPQMKKGEPVNVFVLSDGNATWGKRDVNPLVAKFEARAPQRTQFHCYRFGIGAENLELYQALTHRGGGIFQAYTKDGLKAVATAHRTQCWQIDKVEIVGQDASDVLVAGRKSALYPGGELIVTGRVPQTGDARIRVSGLFQGKQMVREYPIEVGGGSELAARAWAEVAVASLLAMNEPRFDDLVTAYCQQFNIGSRVASFLVLENEADYKRFNLEEERGKTLNGDLGEFLKTLWREMAKAPTSREELEQFLSRIAPGSKLYEGANGTHVKKLLAMLSEEDLTLPSTLLEGEILKVADVPKAYVKALGDRDGAHGIIDEAKRRTRLKDSSGAVRALSTIIEQHPTRSDALRLVGYRLQSLDQPDHAVRLFEQVQRQRPFEPHSYRDLARSLERSGKHGLAALQYEIVLAGDWHGRFGSDLKNVAREEYARMMREAISRKQVTGKLAEHFGERLERLTKTDLQSDVRVTITWNTDSTDVDLWVIEPDGTKCFYEHNKTKNGGQLSQDLTQGYGPERYVMKRAIKGTYRVLVHYYSANRNLIGGETHVDVVITRHAGTPRETVERRVVILKKHNDVAEVMKLTF